MKIALVQKEPTADKPDGMRSWLGLAVPIALAAACSGINSQTNSFATLAEARQASAIAAGRIPDGLPPGSHDLREAHVPGTGRRWGIVNFPEAEAAALRALLTPDEIQLDGQRSDAPARIEWWPVVLRGSLSGERIAATGLRSYKSKDGQLIFAVNWTQGRAYYWAVEE
jgi:hypothetical protein